LNAPAVEPLRAELEAFLESVRTRKQPKTDGVSGRASLELAVRVMQSIQEHAERVQLTDSSRAPRPAASLQNEAK
jgi:predicted dehydrogenase